MGVTHWGRGGDSGPEDAGDSGRGMEQSMLRELAMGGWQLLALFLYPSYLSCKAWKLLPTNQMASMPMPRQQRHQDHANEEEAERASRGQVITETETYS